MRYIACDVLGHNSPSLSQPTTLTVKNCGSEQSNARIVHTTDKYRIYLPLVLRND